MPIFWIQILPVAFLLLLGLAVGTLVERMHFRSLARREAALSYVVVTNTKAIPAGSTRESCGLVVGEVVIAADYFKTFLARFRKMVGGNVRTYETLMERARREAILRMQESAVSMGANRVINVRLASSDIGGMRRRRRAAMVEIYAYGTAIYVPQR